MVINVRSDDNRSVRYRVRLVAATLVAVQAATGCAADPEPPLPSLPAADAALLGRWTDLTTNLEVPAGEGGGPLTVIVFPSSNRCAETKDTLMMRTAWPLGRTAWPPYDVPSFLRDTDDAEVGTIGESDLNASIPASAPEPRFTRNGNTIRVDGRARWAYLVRTDGRIERWARLRSNVGECG